jgi:DNA polymerase-1
MAACTLTYCGETQIVIASFNSDFFQLIDEKVCVLRYRGDKQPCVTARLFEKDTAFHLCNTPIYGSSIYVG